MLRHAARHVLAALCLVMVCWFSPAFALDEPSLVKAETGAQDLVKQLRGIQDILANQEPTDELLATQRDALDKLRGESQKQGDAIAGPLGEVQSQVTELGPPPGEGHQETAAISLQRQQLGSQLARLTAIQKQYVLLGLETDQTQARITAIQRSQFLQRVFQSGHSILDPRMWVETAQSSGTLWQRIANKWILGVAIAKSRFTWAPLLILPIGLLAVWLLVFRGLPKVFERMGLATAPPEPGQAESGLLRLWRVLWGMVKLAFVIFFLMLSTAVSLNTAGLLTSDLNTLFSALMSAIQPALLQGGLVYLVAAPRHPERRLIAIDNQSARTLTLLVFVAALVYGFGEQISNLAGTFNLPVSFAIGQSAFTALALIMLIGLGLVILRRQATSDIGSGAVPYFLTWYLKLLPLLWLMLGIASLALVFGFIALSYFIAGNLLDTAVLLVFIGVLHAFADALAASLLDPQSGPGHFLRRFTQWGEQAIARIVLIFRTIADAILVIAALASLIGLWTVVLFDVGSVFTMVSQGVKIGNITVSPTAIAVALAVLSIGIFITRYITRWLDSRVLSATQLDKGVQNSLSSVAGYAGYILAATLALSAAGVDFSSLALVAGALGVGIGLGLQSIVTNFVSGLILLAERPVRVGDWVATKSGEGIVKKINVRSTEIETFDNCTVIVPNSMLVNDAVKNWTHRDSVGRFTVNISFVHSIDPAQVTETLLKLAREHPKVMRHPPPSVTLSSIATNALVFDLHGHTMDVFEGAMVASDLRMAIMNAFPKKQFAVPQILVPATTG